jgi:hypothetical protein
MVSAKEPQGDHLKTYYKFKVNFFENIIKLLNK